MRQLLLLIATTACLCIPMHGLAQDYSIIAPHVLTDTSRAMQLTIRCGVLLGQKKYDEAIATATEATIIYTRSGMENHQVALAWEGLCKGYFYSDKLDEALHAGEVYTRIFKKIYPENHPKVVQSYYNLGLLYSSKKDYERSFESYRKSLAIMWANGDSCATPLTLRSIATNLLNLGRYREALDFLLQAQSISSRCRSDTTMETIALLNEIGVAYGALGQPYKEIEYLENACAWFKKYDLTAMFPDNLGIGIQVMNNLCTAYGNLGRFDQAIALGKEVLTLRLKYQSSSRFSIAVAYNNLASIYNKKGDFKLACTFLEKAISLLPDDKQSETLRASFYSNLGVSYSNLGDIGRAIGYQEQALRLRLKNLRTDHPDIAGTYHNLASNYTANDDAETAIALFQSAITTFQKSQGTAHPTVAFFYSGLSQACDQAGKRTDAIQYTEQALKLFDGVFPEGNPFMIVPLLNLGEWYTKAGHTDQALHYVRRASILHEKFYGPTHAGLAACHTMLGSALQASGNYSEAEAAFGNAITLLETALLDSTTGPEVLLQVISANRRIADSYQNRYRQTHESALLAKSRRHYTQALDALNRLSRSVSPASKSSLAAQSVGICAGGIATDLLLCSRPDSLHAFDLAERSKACILFEAMKDADALHIAGIPDSLLEHERDLRLGIVFFEKRRQELRDSMPQQADSLSLAFGSALLDLKNRHEALVRFFEEKFPEYYRAKYGLATPAVADLQAMLRPGQTLLEYTVGDSAIFAFVIRPDHFSVHTLPRDFPLEQTVDSLTHLGIYAYYTLPKPKRTQSIEKNSVRNYTNAARLLYEKLMAPVAAHLTEDLVVIPDGVLGYVPFEALLTGEPARRSVFSTYKPHFLAQRHRISYCYSATLLREMRDKRHRTEPLNNVLALAPFFREDTATLHFKADSADLLALRDAFGPLHASGDEAHAVAQLLGGSALYGPEASLDTFRRLAPNVRVLHLSTHGKADDRAGDYAWLALGVPGDTSAFDKLYARDLYGIGLNADLVVLSACETATGKLRRGEGIVSLARAFSFAGAKSLVTSLWKVDDAATKNLMVNFYRYLHDGRAKDAALHQAKLDFLNQAQATDTNLLHPFFWAGFVAVGDMQPLK